MTDIASASSKVVTDRAQLARRAAELRAKGRKVVFTNGCFDLLHVGHVRLLEAARAEGDALIVGLNTDASVRGLKGPTRPLVPLAERMEVMAALGCVDLVGCFDEPDPHAIITAVQPDVLVKGGDWGADAIIGRDVVEARGGKVVRVNLVEGRSTTNLVERIRQQA